MSGVTPPLKPSPAGVAAFLTPCLILAATVATTLRQLGVPFGGWSFTVLLYLVFDFLLFRIRRRQPALARLRNSLSNGEETETPATNIDEGGTKVAQPSRQGAGGSAAAAHSKGQLVGAVPGGPSAKQQVFAPASTAGAASAAQSAGLRLSMLGQDVYVNGDSPFEFENDFFKGRMLFLVKCNPPDPKWAAHFQGENSNRAFEMQIQGKLKLLPKGEVYMGGELGERPKQGLVTQTVSKVVMSFAKQMVKSLHYSFGERRTPSDPLDAEKPHVTFPLYRVMDWFVVTPEAEEPPALGGKLAESAEERAARRGGKSPDIVWSTDVTYTMAFQSGIVNFQDWAVTDIPGQGSLDLNTFLCKQPVTVVVYDFTASSASASTHKARDKSYMFQCTISNDAPGQVARPAVVAASLSHTSSAEGGVTAARGSTAPRSSTTSRLGGTGHGGEEEPDRDTEDCDKGSTVVTDEMTDEQTRDDGRTSPPSPLRSPEPCRHREDITRRLSGAQASPTRIQQLPFASVNRSYYAPTTCLPDEKDFSSKGLVKSGAILPLLTGIAGGNGGEGGSNEAQHEQPALLPQNAYHEFLGEGNGGRVAMREGTAMPAGVQIFKVGGSEDTFRSDYLYEGDVIILHHPESRKFVRVGRGWTLGWSSKATASKIHFVVKGIQPGRPLAHGQAFSLGSRRWSDWDVGVAKQASNKLGGRGLGCFNNGKRRNTSRLCTLTLVARPWFDPDKEGVIPALEAEADAITIAARDPFEDVISAGEGDEEDDDASDDAARSYVEEGSSDSEYTSDVDVDRVIRSQSSSLIGDGISTKAGRAMQCYPDKVGSLRVSVPAWVEFLHRGRRQGQLAFLLAVHPTAPPSTTTPPPPPATSSSSLSSMAASLKPSSSGSPSGNADDIATASATDGAGGRAGANTGADGTKEASPNKASNAAAPAATAAADGGAAQGGNGSPASSGAKPPSPPAWVCVRTGRELSGAVQAYRESVAGSVKAGSWLPKPRPKVIGHMGTADQSVQLLSHEVSEMQRWEASFWSRGDTPPSSPHHDKAGPTADSASSPLPRDPKISTTLEAGADSEMMSPKRTPSDVDNGLSSPPPLLRSPVLSAERREQRLSGGGGASDSPGSYREARTQSSVSGDDVQAADRSLSASLTSSVGAVIDSRYARKGGEEATSPYRMLCRLVSSPGELDRHFLSGSRASDLGVTLGTSGAAPILGCPVARCLWESHWREEWVVLFPSHVACYPPLSKKPSWVLPLKNLRKASAVSDERCPFPGLRCLRLETIGRAHYLCYTSRDSRDTWLTEILRLSKGGVADIPSGLELSQDPRETYVLKTTQWRLPARLVLNARRPCFDLLEGVNQSTVDQHNLQQPWELSAQLLRSAFKVHADPGNQRLVPFLDLTSTLRKVDLSSLDLDSDEALCFFGNLYHLLVRHMLLVLGPPSSSKEWPSSFVQVSYEVGDDVFSLQELEHCVLRGRLPRPSLKDFPKRFAPLPPEKDDHYAYSLGKADSRMSLFLNNGSQSNPSAVVLLTPEMLNEQLNSACQAFVDHTVKTDPKRRQILVHKVFQLYARDLQPLATSRDMVRYGLRFAGKAVIHGLAALDVDISSAQIRYHPYLLKCHETMYLLDLPTTLDNEASPSHR